MFLISVFKYMRSYGVSPGALTAFNDKETTDNMMEIVVRNKIKISTDFMDDFEEMWNQQEEGAEKTKPIEITGEYQMKDGLAKYELFSKIFQLYFHAKYGDKLSYVQDEEELFGVPKDPYNVEFHLK